jgi:dTDP-4-dehydrorhamnose reductase
MNFHKLFQNTVQHYRVPEIPSHWRILITGVTSIHGWPVFEKFRQQLGSHQLLAVRPPKMQIPAGDNVFSLCITDIAELESIRETFRPTHVIHGSGVCDLDACEARPDWARELNQMSARAITEVFGETAYLLFLSTDLVFSGNTPPTDGYSEQQETDPVSVVGKTLLAAEQEIQCAARHCVLRLGLPVGDSITGGKGPIDFIESRFKRGLKMTLFYDELRSCITCDEIAEIVWRLLVAEPQGVFHCGGAESISLYRMGQSILKKGNYLESLLIRQSRHDEVNGPPRIGNVGLDSSKLVQWLEDQYGPEAISSA